MCHNMMSDEDHPLRMTRRADALTREKWHTKLTEITREPEMAQYAQHSSRPTIWQKIKKKGVSTLGTKRNLDYHTLYEPLTCIWRATPINEEQFLQFTVIRDETWANHTTFETTKIISPSEDIQSNTVGKEHHDNCLERPQMCASCILPWPRWHCQELLWYNCEVTARH